ncbi:MAG: cobalt-precorrin 5A hydrolase [Ruminococcus sp.]|nr:cobalt-precorrin 5A hydrolase [Ruminococcus sp.]
MNIAVVSVTNNGKILSSELKVLLSAGHEVKRYCFRRYTDSSAISFDSVYAVVSEIFSNYDAIIFVCACGISVRAIAPHISSKITDPAVVVIDEGGKFVISLISGHLGGANALTSLISAHIGAIPVITTATDTGGKFSPDSFAKANDLIITDMEKAKKIAAAVLNGEKIGFSCDYPFRNPPPEITENICGTGIYIGTNPDFKPFPLTLRLIPRNISLGIGCRRNTPFSAIYSLFLKIMRENLILPERVCAVSSVNLKENESGILEFCRKIDVKPTFYTAERLAEVSGQFSGSEFVKKITGIDNICERSAVCGGGRLIIGKCAANGVTLAAAEREIIVDFERKIL